MHTRYHTVLQERIYNSSASLPKPRLQYVSCYNFTHSSLSQVYRMILHTGGAEPDLQLV